MSGEEVQESTSNGWRVAGMIVLALLLLVMLWFGIQRGLRILLP